MTIWLFGDSVLQGGALGRWAVDWPEPARVLEKPADLLSALIGRQNAVRYGADTLLSEAPEKCIRSLRRMLSSGTIADGDTIFFLDVGSHLRDPDLHERSWRRIVEAAVAEHPVHAVLCGGFDNGAEWLASATRDPRKVEGLIDCLYDLPFGDRSHNDAIRAAAQTEPQYAGHVTWLPLSEAMDAFQKACREHGASAYHDPVHPNVWGQLKLCSLLLAGIDQPAPAAERVARLCTEHWRALRAPSEEAAEAMVTRVLADVKPVAA